MKFHCFPKVVIAFATCCVIAISARPVVGQEAMARPMQINIDLRDLPRKLVHVELTLPLTPASENRTIAIWYPKWVPGSHGPGGPIANIAGLKIEDPQGNRLSWLRTAGEVYRLEVTVPPHADEIRIFLRYITNQPTTTSFGHDCFSASNIGVISPGSLLLCPETADIDVQQITTRLQLPQGWHVATALKTVAQSQKESSILSYQAVSLRTLVDSPIMCGLHYQTFDLVEKSRRDEIPKHTLHVFGDEAAHADLNEAVVEKLRAMVTQAALLIGSHPFDRFDILLAASNELPKNGLEHSRSTFNVLPPKPLQSLSSLKGWDRLLIPHEYIHAWCGKYRRPAGMLTKDFHTPKDTELLWVYEGLTQYLGELVEARSGLMSPAEFRHRITVELRKAMHQQGRKWRTLADTAAASHILRDASPSWSGLRRSQDYYMEGMLFWLEADALIRRDSDGARSLDDFCQKFLGSTAASDHPFAFTREDIVHDLKAVADLDWDSLIRRRIESFQEEYDPTVASLLGYKFSLQRKAPTIPATTFRRQSGIDVLDSLGMVVSRDGNVQTLLMGSPADRARLRPAIKIIGVNGMKWSGSRLTDALVQGQDRSPIDLLVEDGDVLRTIQLHYYEGPRYWNMVRQTGEPDLLREIVKKK
jgi:predicted metalloprotease with PDZ domain